MGNEASCPLNTRQSSNSNLITSNLNINIREEELNNNSNNNSNSNNNNNENSHFNHLNNQNNMNNNNTLITSITPTITTTTSTNNNNNNNNNPFSNNCNDHNNTSNITNSNGNSIFSSFCPQQQQINNNPFSNNCNGHSNPFSNNNNSNNNNSTVTTTHSNGNSPCHSIFSSFCPQQQQQQQNSNNNPFSNNCNGHNNNTSTTNTNGNLPCHSIFSSFCQQQQQQQQNGNSHNSHDDDDAMMMNIGHENNNHHRNNNNNINENNGCNNNNNNNNNNNHQINQSTPNNSPCPMSSNSPGAYSMPGQCRNQRFYVTIPRGVQPGQHFAVLVNGQQMMVRCPPGSGENDRLIVTPPRVQSQQYVVTVPAGVKPGDRFRVSLNGTEVLVTCPPNVQPNQRVTFQLPNQDRPPCQGPCAAPNHQMFEVLVPAGVKPGQSFALVANGQRVMVTCPFNVSAGQKIRFQLPIKLTQQQLESVRVDYHKDGWMRCLGSDLNFHWVYNTATNAQTSQETSGCPIHHRKICELNRHAFVREITTIGCPRKGGKFDIHFIDASTYSMPSTVPGTKLNYQELSTAALYPFQQKCDWIKHQFSQIRVPWEVGHIRLKIRRSNLLADSFDSIESLSAEDMKKIFRIEFIGEPGLDAGGVTREWYELLTSQLFNPDCGLFQYSSVNQMCLQINPNSGLVHEHHLKFYHFAGRILGKSLMDGQITPIHLVSPLYKHLLGYPIMLRDLEHIDNQIYRNLLELLQVDDISMLYLDFTITQDCLGKTETISLIPNGSDVMVTNQNLIEYLTEQLKYRLLTRIKPQLLEFLRGFYEIVPEPFIAAFNSQELELLLHGIPNIDLNDWMNNTEYTGEFTNNKSHQVIQWFWEIVSSYSQENRAKLLQFSTGTSGVPAQGFGFLQGNDGNIRKFTLMGSYDVKIFPRSHTCFNRIDLPMYTSKAEMMKYLTIAITLESTGFELE